MSHNQQQAAEQLLESPLDYPGLATRKFARVLLRVWTYPAFDPYCSWAIVATKTEYFLRRVTWDQRVMSPSSPVTYGAEVPIDRTFAESVEQALQAIQLPAFIPVNTIGLDGVSNGVEVGSYMASATFRWWCEPPELWHALSTWHSNTIRSFEALLPERTT